MKGRNKGLRLDAVCTQPATEVVFLVASGIPSRAQPYYLIYYMKGTNKGIRLDIVCAPLATEVVSFAIRSKIRYHATTAGIPTECLQTLDNTGTANVRTGRAPSRQSRRNTGTDKKECNKDITAGDPADQNSSCMGDYYYY